MAERSADVLTQTVLKDPDLLDQVRNDPQATLPRQAAIAKSNTPVVDDPTVYRIVTASLSLAILLVTGGLIYLAVAAPVGDNNTRKPVPTNALIALGSACVGALGGLLSPTLFRK